jgi:hypothetical protein
MKRKNSLLKPRKYRFLCRSKEKTEGSAPAMTVPEVPCVIILPPAVCFSLDTEFSDVARKILIFRHTTPRTEFSPDARKIQIFLPKPGKYKILHSIKEETGYQLRPGKYIVFCCSRENTKVPTPPRKTQNSLLKPGNTDSLPKPG